MNVFGLGIFEIVDTVCSSRSGEPYQVFITRSQTGLNPRMSHFSATVCFIASCKRAASVVKPIDRFATGLAMYALVITDVQQGELIIFILRQTTTSILAIES